MNLLGITSVLVPGACIEKTHAHLRAVGRNGLEGLALWAGTGAGERFHVTEAIIPVQRGIRSDAGVSVAVGPQELHRMNVFLFQNKLSLVAQIHSHPGAAYHSDTDDDHAIATKAGALSLVVPDFASQPFSLEQCAVYRLSAAGKWRELSAREAAELIIITE